MTLYVGCDVFCFEVPATTEIYAYWHTPSLHGALPILQTQASKFGDHRNLAGEATSLGRPLSELDQIALHAAFFRRPDPIHPGQVDMDMARGAGTDPAAIAVDPRHTVE